MDGWRQSIVGCWLSGKCRRHTGRWNREFLTRWQLQKPGRMRPLDGGMNSAWYGLGCMKKYTVRRI